jgi:hypothetical protein
MIGLVEDYHLQRSHPAINYSVEPVRLNDKRALIDF